MKYKLICTDMDGTLLGTGFNISEENIIAIKKAKEKGIKIALVTGRPYNAMKYFRKLLGEDTYIISTNGTYFKANGQEYKKHLDKDSIKKIFKLGEKFNLIRHFKGSSLVITTNSIDKHHPYIFVNENLNEKDKLKIIQNASLEETLLKCNDEIYKCLIFSNNIEGLLKAKDEINKDDTLEVVSSNFKNFEVMPKGTSKGIALIEFCKILNINKNEVICIGDNDNDISMLKFAGISIAMGNAPKNIKNIATYITDTNINNGVAKAIEKLVLNNY